jgi:hypothetical protein
VTYLASQFLSSSTSSYLDLSILFWLHFVNVIVVMLSVAVLFLKLAVTFWHMFMSPVVILDYRCIIIIIIIIIIRRVAVAMYVRVCFVLPPVLYHQCASCVLLGVH